MGDAAGRTLGEPMSKHHYDFSAYADLNSIAAKAVSALVADAALLRLAVTHDADGVTIVDAGVHVVGGLEAGRRIAEICMGGLGQVTLNAAPSRSPWNWQVNVTSLHPVLACLASQYAGWSLEQPHGEKTFRALGSGPARTLGSKEPLFDELGYRCAKGPTCMVIECGEVPPPGLGAKIADACGIPPSDLTLILTPTSSFAGAVQVVGRVLEVGLHKVHALGFPLDQVLDGAGSAPICPMSGDFLSAMGRTNDAIIFGGLVHLFVDATDDDAAELAKHLPSETSRDFGRPFAEVFKAVGYDFYKVDPNLFSPAQVAVTAMKSGKTFTAGRLHPELLSTSFSS